jgi:hypothetical protein
MPAHIVRRIGVVALLVATLAPASSFAGDPSDASADASADRVNATTVVPDPARKVGEVRLLQRGPGVVVQTLLVTKLLSRVVSEIHDKEHGNWPADYEPARSYLAALDAARDAVEKGDSEGGDRHRRLLIEFAADDQAATVSFGTFDSDAEARTITPRNRRILQTLALPRDYVLRNMRLILADSFKMAEADVDRLGPLGPASAETVAKLPPKPAPGKAARPEHPGGSAP